MKWFCDKVLIRSTKYKKNYYNVYYIFDKGFLNLYTIFLGISRKFQSISIKNFNVDIYKNVIKFEDHFSPKRIHCFIYRDKFSLKLLYHLLDNSYTKIRDNSELLDKWNNKKLIELAKSRKSLKKSSQLNNNNLIQIKRYL